MALLDPDPVCESGSRDPIESGYGSATLHVPAKNIVERLIEREGKSHLSRCLSGKWLLPLTPNKTTAKTRSLFLYIPHLIVCCT
jgi:hypothetical protein